MTATKSYSEAITKTDFVLLTSDPEAEFNKIDKSSRKERHKRKISSFSDSEETTKKSKLNSLQTLPTDPPLILFSKFELI